MFHTQNQYEARASAGNWELWELVKGINNTYINTHTVHNTLYILIKGTFLYLQKVRCHAKLRSFSNVDAAPCGLEMEARLSKNVAQRNVTVFLLCHTHKMFFISCHVSLHFWSQGFSGCLNFMLASQVHQDLFPKSVSIALYFLLQTNFSNSVKCKNLCDI